MTFNNSYTNSNGPSLNQILNNVAKIHQELQNKSINLTGSYVDQLQNSNAKNHQHQYVLGIPEE